MRKTIHPVDPAHARRAVTSIAVVVGIATLVAPAANAASHKAVPSCTTVTPAKIKTALGIVVKSPSVTKGGTGTTCMYAPNSMIVQLGGGFSKASLKTVKASFNQHSEPTTTVTGIGDAAFTSTLGSGKYATNTIVVDKGSTELLITVPMVSLTKVEALAKAILPAM
jgi:hypothetical protein